MPRKYSRNRDYERISRDELQAIHTRKNKGHYLLHGVSLLFITPKEASKWVMRNVGAKFNEGNMSCLLLNQMAVGDMLSGETKDALLFNAIIMIGGIHYQSIWLTLFIFIVFMTLSYLRPFISIPFNVPIPPLFYSSLIPFAIISIDRFLSDSNNITIQYIFYMLLYRETLIGMIMYPVRALNCKLLPDKVNYNNQNQVNLIIKMFNYSKLSRMFLSTISQGIIILMAIYGDRTNIYELVIQTGTYLITIEVIYCYLGIIYFTNTESFNIGYYFGHAIPRILSQLSLWYFLSDLGIGYQLILQPVWKSNYIVALAPVVLFYAKLIN